MKRLLKLLAFVLPLFAVSCVDSLQDGVKTEEEVKTVTITLHSNATKTTLTDDQYVSWEPGDRIYINEKEYEVVIDESDPEVAYVENVEEAEIYVAVYYSSVFERDKNRLVLSIPQYQTYRPGGFGQYANTMVAASTTTDLFFYNVASVLKLGVKGEGSVLKSLSIAGNNGEQVSGWFAITLDDLNNLPEKCELSELEDELSQNKRYTVELQFENGIQLSENAQYVYVVLPAKTYEKGFTVTLADTEGRVCVQSTDKSVTTKRSEIIQMADFTFNPITALEVTGITPDKTSVSYSVSAAPGSSVMTLLVYKSMWDMYLSGSYYQNDAEKLSADILGAMGTTVQIGADGKYEAMDTKAFNYNKDYTSMFADVDYKLLAAYADEDNAKGKVLVYDVRTLAPTGTAPEISAQVNDLTFNTANVVVNVTETAVNINCRMVSKSLYDEMTALGYDDKGILTLFGSDFSAEALEAAKTQDGYTIYFEGFGEGTSWVFLAMAVDETGMASVTKFEFTTPWSTPYPGKSWTTLSTSAWMDCGLLTGLWLESNFLCDAITVEQADGEDIFRLVNLHDRLNACVGTEIFKQTGQNQYIYIDARDSGNVTVESTFSILYVHEEYSSSYDSEFAIVSLGGQVQDYACGSYDKQSGIINLGGLGYFFSMNGEVLGYYPMGGTTVLHLNLDGTDTPVLPEVPPTPIHGLQTENFTKTDKIEW